jgi:hypothetical protein
MTQKLKVESGPVDVLERCFCQVCDGAHGWIGEYRTTVTAPSGARASVLHCCVLDCREQAKTMALAALGRTIDVPPEV